MIKNNKRKPGALVSHATTVNKQRKYCDQNELEETVVFSKNQVHGIIKNYTQPINIQQQQSQECFQEDHQQIPTSVNQISSLQPQQLKRITSLNFSNNSLSEFPSTLLSKLSNLTQLNLSSNNLQKFSIPYLDTQNLKKLTLSNNNIQGLNLEHIKCLTQLECVNNNLNFITLPENIEYIQFSNNCLSNLYFLEKCSFLEYVGVAFNCLYDVKWKFRNGCSIKQEEVVDVRYKYMKVLDCSNNKIQNLADFINIINLKSLKISNNNISATRTNMNQILILQNLQELDIRQNPYENQERAEETDNMMLRKMDKLLIFNGEDIERQLDQSSVRSVRGFQIGYIRDQPYQLFMSEKKWEQESKEKELLEVGTREWNFTLGDCEQQQFQAEDEGKEIKDLSQIDIIDQSIQTKPTSPNKHPQTQQKNQLIITHIKKSKQTPQSPHNKPSNLKLKLIKTTSPLQQPHHIFYKPYLQYLLQYSFIPTEPILQSKSKIISHRLDIDHDDYKLIQEMFLNRGGVVYVRKIMKWVLREGGRQVADGDGRMGFLMNQLEESKFKELCKSKELIQRSSRDIIGLQPNIFSCYHIIVRNTPTNNSQQNYNCSYLIETSFL